MMTKATSITLVFIALLIKKLALGDKYKTPLPVLKHNITKLKIDSDSESESEEEEEQFVIPNTEHVEFPEETKIIIP